MICDELVSKISEIFLGEVCMLRDSHFYAINDHNEVAIASLYGEEFNNGTFKIYFTITGGNNVYTLFTGNSYHIYRLSMDKDSYGRLHYYIEDISEVTFTKKQIAIYEEDYDTLTMYSID